MFNMLLVPAMFSLVGNSLDASARQPIVVTAYLEGRPSPLVVSPIQQRDRKNRKMFLSRRAAENFRDMMVDAARQGIYIRAVSAYRTHHEQRILRRRLGSVAAPPGWSNHQQGISVDIAGTRRTIKGKKYRTILFWWLKRNAKEYGFYNDVPEEPWHWTFKEVREYG